jgi:hypothetical protein
MDAETVAGRSQNAIRASLGFGLGKELWVARTREEIVELIKKMAASKGGNVGMNAFIRESGVKDHELGLHGTWNELKREAGLETRNFLEPRTELASLLPPFARIVAQGGVWPTQDRLRRERTRDASFPSLKLYRAALRHPDFYNQLLAYCRGQDELADVIPIVLARQTSAEHNAVSSSDASVAGYVYMMRSARAYKIGRTNSPSRRHREVRLELPTATILNDFQ